MSYKIFHSEENAFITIVVRGEINSESAMEQNVEAHALGKKLGINKYLVDVREARNTDSLLGQHDFAYKDIPQCEGIDKTALVAMLVDPRDESHNFIEAVTQNSGLNVRLFYEEEDAIAYLST